MSSLTLEDFDKCCRWCLTLAGNKNVILQSCLDTMLYALTSLKVRPDDGYPQLACRSCVLKLSTAYNFRQMVIQNNRKLSIIIKSTQLKQLEQQTQDVHILDNIITETDSDHESYAMSAINMKVVETLDDDDQAGRCTDERGWTAVNTNIPKTESHFTSTIDSEVERDPIVHDLTEDPTDMDAETFLKCRHCPAKFRSLRDRQTHTLTHSECCKICNKIVKRQNIARHALTHTQYKRHACRVCDKRFHDVSNRNTHEQICKGVDIDVSAPKKFLCNYCGNKYKWRTSLIRHVRHHKAQTLLCAVCQLQFTDLLSLRKHQRMHEILEYFSCPECPTKLFSSQRSLNSHLKIRHATHRQIFSCGLCQKVYRDKVSLNRHQAVHLRPAIKCQHCDKIFANNRSLTKHLLDVYENNVPTTQTEERQEYFNCPKCTTEKFTTQRSLNNHLKIVHATQRPTFPCEQCHKVYRDRVSLNRHQAVHSRPAIKCQHCDKIFVHNRSLTRHLLVHKNNVIAQ